MTCQGYFIVDTHKTFVYYKTMMNSDMIRKQPRLFSWQIRMKFPEQIARHIACPSNARWMLRNVPTSPFSRLEKRELIEWSKVNAT